MNFCILIRFCLVLFIKKIWLSIRLYLIWQDHLSHQFWICLTFSLIKLKDVYRYDFSISYWFFSRVCVRVNIQIIENYCIYWLAPGICRLAGFLRYFEFTFLIKFLPCCLVWPSNFTFCFFILEVFTNVLATKVSEILITRSLL